MRTLALLSSVLLALPNAAKSADFHPISSVTTSTSGDLYPVANLIQGPGSGYAASVPHNQIGGGATHTWVTYPPAADWYSVEPAPVLIFDLGTNRALSEISTWGYADTNTNGAKDFTLRFATAAEGSGGFGTSITYNPSFEAAFPTTERDSHSFSQTVNARYVEMTITDNWRGFQGGTPGGDRVGLGEVAFEDSVPPVDPQISLPANLNLELDGSVQTIDVPISNIGLTQTLLITGTSFTGTNAAAFSVTGAPASLGPGASTVIQLNFNPTGLSGNVSANLIVDSNDSSSPVSTVAMSGFIHDPKLVAPNSLHFGNFPTGAGSQIASLIITNEGGGQTLNITSTSIAGGGAANFSVTSAPSSLAPLANGTIQLEFDPMGSDGIYTAQLEIASNDPFVPTRTVNLTANVGDSIPNSGVRINEFMASNSNTIDDGDGNSSDWIELFNAGPGSVDLSGWYLTDNSGNLTAWEFPPGTTLAENAYMIVFASNEDKTDVAGFLHTNFKLSTNGEYLALVMPNGSTIVSEFSPTFPAQFGDISYGTFSGGGSTSDLIAGSDADVLIPPDGTLALTWTALGFDSSSWDTGPGNSTGYERTGSDYAPYYTIDVESDFYNADSSVYMRIPFTVADTSLVQSLTLSMRYDDGFVAYLNGNLLWSENAEASPVWDDRATASHEAGASPDNYDVTASIGDLLNGNNVLAIQGLNRSIGSSDFLITPTLNASLGGTGPLSIGYLQLATPGSANTGGAANPGPEITDVVHSPAQPSESQDIVVTATITPRLAQVSAAQLHYRVVYGGEVTLSMINTGGDTFSATIPSSAFGAEDMVRWRITATDVDSNVSAAPPFLDTVGNNQSPEYFGTVTQDPSVTSDLPILQWFTQSVSGSHTRTGARASVYFDGRFYDNIFVRQRGGATNGSISQKFDFNKGDPFYANAEMPSVGEININGNGADSTYVRQTLSFDAHREAGVAGCLSELWQLRVNGGSDRVGVFIEQVDEDFLDRNGYDRDGDLYKMVQRSNLDPVFNDIITGIEKKTNDKSDLTTLGDFVAGLNLPTSAQRRAYVIDNIDLSQVLNYLAARSIIQDADDLRKNFYVYRDIHGDDRWRMFPWDKDFTFGVRGDGGTHLPHPFFGDEEHKKQNANQWNVLYDVLFEETTTQRLYLRRLRTLMDELLQPTSTPVNQRYFENRADEIIDAASPPLSGNISSINSYLSSRRSVLFNNYPSLIPGPQPANPNITISEAEYNPSSGNQDEEYIRLSNAESTEIDISGWTLSGGVDFTFPPGTVIERNSDLYVCPDTKAFVDRATSPKGGEFNVAVGPYSGHISNFGETLTLSDSSAAVVDTFSTPVDPSDPQLYLAISEIMYHPADPTPDAEFIEVMNISDTVTLDLTGVKFTAGIDYEFPGGTMLAPGARFVINFADFLDSSRLNNGSDRIKLEDATNSTVRDFSYDDDAPWPEEADGDGFSLVLIDPTSNPDHGEPGSWRSSTTVGGNPGTSDAVTFSGNPDDDLDEDGLPALLEHAIGTSDSDPSADPLTISTADDRLTVTVQKNQGADDVTLALEMSTDLVVWSDPPAEFAMISSTNNGDGTATLVYQSTPAFFASEPRRFLRLSAALNP